MIESFKCEESKRVFDQIGSRKLPIDIQRSALRKLLILNQAISLGALAEAAGNNLEKLRGDRAGQYSIRINDQWRICFKWSEPSRVTDVEIVDYH